MTRLFARFLNFGARFAANERVGFQRGVLAAGNGLHHRRRAEHHVAGVENSLGFRDRQFGPAADGGNHEVELAEDRRFLFADDEILRSRSLARRQHHPRDAKAGDALALVNDGERLGATGDLDAVFEQQVALILRQRHVLLPAAINQFNRSRAQPFGRRRAIRRHRAAAEDGDFFAFEFELLLVFQKRLPRKREFLAGDVQLDRFSQASAHNDGIMLRQQFFRVGHGLAVFEFNVAKAFEKCDVRANDLLVQPEIRNEIHRPADAASAVRKS